MKRTTLRCVLVIIAGASVAPATADDERPVGGYEAVTDAGTRLHCERDAGEEPVCVRAETDDDHDDAEPYPSDRDYFDDELRMQKPLWE